MDIYKPGGSWSRRLSPVSVVLIEFKVYDSPSTGHKFLARQFDSQDSGTHLPTSEGWKAELAQVEKKDTQIFKSRQSRKSNSGPRDCKALTLPTAPATYTYVTYVIAYHCNTLQAFFSAIQDTGFLNSMAIGVPKWHRIFLILKIRGEFVFCLDRGFFSGMSL